MSADGIVKSTPPQAWEIVNEAQMHAAAAYLRYDQPTWDKMTSACEAYHRCMILATPGLRVHQADGRIRLPVEADL